MDLFYWSVRSFYKRGGYGVKGGELGNYFSQLQVLVNQNLLNLYDPPVKLFIGPGMRYNYFGVGTTTLMR